MLEDLKEIKDNREKSTGEKMNKITSIKKQKIENVELKITLV